MFLRFSVIINLYANTSIITVRLKNYAKIIKIMYFYATNLNLRLRKLSLQKNGHVLFNKKIYYKLVGTLLCRNP